MWWLLVACVDSEVPRSAPVEVAAPTGDSGEGGESGESGDTGVAATGGTGDTGGSAALPPLVGDALTCDVSGLSMPSGGAFHRVTLPSAVCNDGTPAAMYVRPAADPTDTRWILYFEGGGSCGSTASCADRWCGEDYDATKMSSRWFPETRGEGGLLADGEPQFGDWNAVFLAYCSSDMWTGTRRDVPLVDASGKVQEYRMHFDGAGTVDAALQWLAAGGASDDGAVVVPPVGAATEVLVAGLSAGAMGVVTHLDRIAADIPSARVVGVIDAMVTPDPAPLGDPTLAAAFDAELERQWHEESVALYGARVDDSCAAAEVDPWRCANPSRVQRLHLGAPFLLVHDLFDGPLASPYVGIGFTVPQYASISAAELAALADARPDVSVFGAACRHHTRIGSDAWYRLQTVDDGARTWSVAEVMAAFVAGERVVVTDDPAGLRSTCP